MLKWNLSNLLIGLLFHLATLVPVRGYVDETTLRSTLRSGYDTFVRPSTPTLIYLFYNLRSLQELDIAEQKMTITGWLSMFWEDPRFKWNATQYGGVAEIELDWGWRPEFYIGNSAGGVMGVGMDNDDTRIRAYNNGSVRWNQVLAATTACEVDISNFPFDTQTCNLEIIYWGYTTLELNLSSVMTTVNTGVYLDNAEWILSATYVEIDAVPFCCPESGGPYVRYYMTFTRRRPFYMMNLIFPTILLSLCMVWVFLLPTDSGERLGFSLTVLLAYTVQLSIIAQMMPTTSKQTPHIARYLLIILILCAVITCNVVINVKLFYKQDAVYRWLQAVYRKLHPIIFLSCCKNSRQKKRVADENDKLDNNSKDSMEFEKQAWSPDLETTYKQSLSDKVKEISWSEISELLDRICFYSYFIVVATVNGVFLNTIAN